jgi:hypothetical protein
MAHRPSESNQLMENPTPFDLKPALQQWRAGLQNLGGISADELEELEEHLRESMDALHARGLSDQEAFMIATRRLGSERQLSDEFAKANPQRVWTERAMWMVAGVLTVLALSAVIAPFKSIVLNCAIWSGLNGPLAWVLHQLAGCFLWAGAATMAYWVLSRHSPPIDHLVQACIRRPVPTGLALFIGLEGLQYGMSMVYRLAEPVYRFFSGHPAPLVQQWDTAIEAWILWGSLLAQVLWIAAGPLSAGLAWRRRGRLASEATNWHALRPADGEATRELKSQGFSFDEASLLLAERCCPQATVASTYGLSSDPGIWLERAAWMVTGTALSQCLDYWVSGPGWLLVMTARPVAPLYQHLVALSSACLGLTVAGAIVAGLWRWITSHPSQMASIGSICRRRPLLAAIALVVVCASLGLCQYALLMGLQQWGALPAQLGLGPIASEWFRYSMALNHLIIPIVLLLWLARRWRGMRTNPIPCTNQVPL